MTFEEKVLHSSQFVFLPPFMKERLKQFAKRMLSAAGIHLTQNQRYDALAAKVMRKAIRIDSNCIDVGCHKGEMLDEMLKLAPEGKHMAFEPIPELFEGLKRRYNGNVTLHQLALSDHSGETSFHHVVSNPAYSGLRERTYKVEEQVQKIQVRTERLDDLLGDQHKLDFLKIDVEGGELQVLKGGAATIARCKPVIVFEHGLGASDHYGTTPDMIYDLLVETCGLRIGLLEDYLSNGKGLSREAFRRQFHESLNYYFVAFP